MNEEEHSTFAEKLRTLCSAHPRGELALALAIVGAREK
jgi:hypothetical protein